METQNSIDLEDRGCVIVGVKASASLNNSEVRDSLLSVTTVSSTTLSLVFDDFLDDYFSAHRPQRIVTLPFVSSAEFVIHIQSHSNFIILIMFIVTEHFLPISPLVYN